MAHEIDRRKFIGGSDAGAILGLSPWRTPYQVWADKTMPKAEDDAKREKYLKRGKRLEPVVLEMLKDETGIEVAKVNERYIDNEHDFMACEIDAESVNGENIEIKTVHPMKAKEWGEENTDMIPATYTAQALHGLMITGRDTCIFAALIGADDLRIYRVEKDVEAIQLLREKEVEFWEHVKTLTPPPLQDLGDVERMFSADNGISITASEDILAAWAQYKNIKGAIKDMGAELEKYEIQLRAFMGEAAQLNGPFGKLATWKTQGSKRLDGAALKEAHPELFNQFTKVTTSRVFRVY